MIKKGFFLVYVYVSEGVCGGGTRRGKHCLDVRGKGGKEKERGWL